MIDPAHETLESLTDLARWDRIPRRRGGKRIHVSTLHRWATKGSRGVTLETTRVGGTLCSSRDALARFFERQSSADRRMTVDGFATPRQREAAIRRAERELNQD